MSSGRIRSALVASALGLLTVAATSLAPAGGSAAAVTSPGTSAAAPAVQTDLDHLGGNAGIGVITGKPRVYLVFWGSQWGTPGADAAGHTTFSADPAGAAVRLQGFFKGLGTVDERWSGVLTQYC